MPLQRSEMLTLEGVCRSTARSPVVGRLLPLSAPPRLHAPSEACLRLCSLAELPHLDTYFPTAETVGIVCIAELDALPPSLADSLSCPVLALPELPEACLGKIALLDPAEGRLFVCPDLSLLDRLLGRPLRLGGEDEPLCAPDGRAFRVGAVLPTPMPLNVQAPSLMIDSPDAEGEEAIYEFLRDLAEQNVPYHRAYCGRCVQGGLAGGLTGDVDLVSACGEVVSELLYLCGLARAVNALYYDKLRFIVHNSYIKIILPSAG